MQEHMLCCRLVLYLELVQFSCHRLYLVFLCIQLKKVYIGPRDDKEQYWLHLASIYIL